MEGDSLVAVIPARIDMVTSGLFRTSLSNGRHHVDTVEHILAAATGCNVDNLVVMIWGIELPILDGSAMPWVNLIMTVAGIEEQAELAKTLKVKDEIIVKDRDSWCSLSPCDAFELSYDLSYRHPMIGDQTMSVVADLRGFVRDIAPSRTFGFYEEINQLRPMGLAAGADLTNAVVFSDSSVLNEGGLRFQDEPVRHKILDAIGDLTLIGARIAGRFHGHRSGHSLNHQLARALMGTV
jgi:UDP-3-O-[3-hydroxymyristoyl] N-acetylglucosamine deacetylase